MAVDRRLFVYVRCADPETAHEILWMACCCHLENASLSCAASPLDPEHSVDIELTRLSTLGRIRGMPGVLEANSCPAGLPRLHDPTEMWLILQQTHLVCGLSPHLLAMA